MPLLIVLGVVFIVLKLVHVIAWSWWLVLLPIYALPLLFVAGLFATGVGIVSVGLALGAGRRR